MEECAKALDLVRIDERLKRHDEKIEELEKIYVVVQKLAENMARLTETTKHLAQAVGAVKTDVEGLKAEPGKEAKQYKFILVGAIIGMVFTALGSLLFQGGM